MQQSGKKKIIIVIHYLEIGGAEVSLIGLLQAMDISLYDVDLFVHCHRGELMKYIPNGVHLLPEIPEYAQIERPLKDVIKDGYWRIAVRRFKAKWKAKRFNKRHRFRDSGVVFQKIANELTPILPLISSTHYDLAISFLIPHNYVLDKVQATKKICWIHTDYQSLSIDSKEEFPIWNAYDKIISISPKVTESFLGVFPSLKDKIMEVRNILSTQFIRSRAVLMDVSEEMRRGREDAVILLSVGRFVFAKNYDNVPEICRLIVDKGINVVWYLIGFGGAEQLIRRRIEEHGMQDHVKILGKKINPYPYIRECDIYVQPSRYEGNSVTVREAQLLCKPVVITNYATANSQVENGKDGIIVPLNSAECAEGIVRFIQNDSQRDTIVKYLHCHDFSNEKEVTKIEGLFI